jgi:predicted nucleic acid-binding protein
VTVIDTSVFVEAQRGREHAKQRLLELLAHPEDVAVSAMTVLEVHAAPRMTPSWVRYYRQLFRSIEVIDLGADAAEEGARLARDAAARGYKLHNGDAAIAGCATHAGAARIITADRDFAELRGIEVELLQPS